MRTFALFMCAATIALALCEVLARQLIVVRDVGPSFSEYDPLLGKTHKKHFSTVRRTPEFRMRFTTNSLGYRGPEPLSYEVATEPVVLCLGDSFTEGYGVDDGQEFPSLLAAELTAGGEHVRTINAGVGDTGTGRALRFLRAYDATEDARHPTVLVYQVASNDFSDNEAEGFFTVDRRGELRERAGDVPRSTMRRLQPMLESIPGLPYSYLFAALGEAAKLHGSRPMSLAASDQSGTGDIAAGGRLTALLEDALLRLTEQRGWPAIVITVGLTAEQRRVLTPVFIQHGASWLLLPNKTERPDLYYRVDGHWTPAGHAYVAAQLLPEVKRLLVVATSAIEPGHRNPDRSSVGEL